MISWASVASARVKNLVVIVFFRGSDLRRAGSLQNFGYLIVRGIRRLRKSSQTTSTDSQAFDATVPPI